MASGGGGTGTGSAVIVTPLAKRRVLIVDDDDAVLRAHTRMLTATGYQVRAAASGAAAMQAMQEGAFEVILSDVDMPGMNGIQLLERVRAHDVDVPVVLMTGNPSTATAIAALERGALRYLLKPIGLPALVKAMEDAVRLHNIARAKRQALALAGGVDRFVGDQASLAASFTRCLESLYMAYQPVVSWEARTTYAYEALLRSREPSLPHPGAVIDAAERLGRVHELGRKVRLKSIEPLRRMPDNALLFLNLHPSDLLDEQLFASDAPLSQVAHRVVLEITERASLHDLKNVRERVASLRALGFRIALDDLGAGYAGLTSFSLLEPNIVKLDMALVRDLHREPMKQTVVRTMVAMCKELGIVVTGEGIENPEERDELARAGCDLMQGYLFARPGDPFPVPIF